MSKKTNKCGTLLYCSRLGGFSLTELAIVIGVVSLVLGAIWVSAGNVYQNMRFNHIATSILSVVNAAKKTFKTPAEVDSFTKEGTAFGGPSCGDCNADSEFFKAGLLPSDFTLNPDQTVGISEQKFIFRVYGAPAPGASGQQGLFVELRFATVDTCIRMIKAFANTASNDITCVTNNIDYLGQCAGGSSYSNAAAINLLCAPTTAGSNTIDSLQFRFPLGR